MRTTTLILASAVLCVALSSCASRKYCLRRYPPVNDTIRIMTVRDSIILRDTTIFIKLPGDTVYNEVEIPCPPPPPSYVPKKVCAETSLASACAWFQWPVIKLELIQKDTTIERRLDNAIKEAWHWRSEYEKITITPAPVKYIPGFFKFCTYAFIGLVIGLLGFIALKILKYI